MIGKLFGNKVVLGALLGLLVGLVAVVGLVAAMGGGSAASPVEAGAAHGETPAAKAGAPAGGEHAGKPAAAKAASKGSAAAPVRFGPTYALKDRVVNLADPGGRRFLRFSVAIEFAPHGEKASSAPSDESRNHLVVYQADENAVDEHLVTGGKDKDPDKAFQVQIKKYVPAIEDAVVSVLSARTYDEVRSLEGKESTKREIKDRVQRAVGAAEHVTNVYFTDFVVQ